MAKSYVDPLRRSNPRVSSPGLALLAALSVGRVTVGGDNGFDPRNQRKTGGRQSEFSISPLGTFVVFLWCTLLTNKTPRKQTSKIIWDMYSRESWPRSLKPTKGYVWGRQHG